MIRYINITTIVIALCGIGVAAFLLMPDRRNECFATLVLGGEEITIQNSDDIVWSVFDWAPDKNGPEVIVNPDFKGIHAEGIDCSLEIARRPTPPLQGYDWRIGLVVAADKIDIRDRTGFAELELRSDELINFAGAAAYAYDGVSVPGQTIERTSSEWMKYTVPIKTTQKSDRLEFWIRLGIGTDIDATGVIELRNMRIVLN